MSDESLRDLDARIPAEERPDDRFARSGKVEPVGIAEIILPLGE